MIISIEGISQQMIEEFIDILLRHSQIQCTYLFSSNKKKVRLVELI